MPGTGTAEIKVTRSAKLLQCPGTAGSAPWCSAQSCCIPHGARPDLGRHSLGPSAPGPTDVARSARDTELGAQLGYEWNRKGH